MYQGCPDALSAIDFALCPAGGQPSPLDRSGRRELFRRILQHQDSIQVFARIRQVKLTDAQLGNRAEPRRFACESLRGALGQLPVDLCTVLAVKRLLRRSAQPKER